LVFNFFTDWNCNWKRYLVELKPKRRIPNVIAFEVTRGGEAHLNIAPNSAGIKPLKIVFIADGVAQN